MSQPTGQRREDNSTGATRRGMRCGTGARRSAVVRRRIDNERCACQQVRERASGGRERDAPGGTEFDGGGGRGRGVGG
jgi:hypothetical protein